jgi:hypothetical protein
MISLREMKKFGLAAALALACFATPAAGEGALAVAIPEGGLRDNFAFGRAIGGDNSSERAMRICIEQATKRGMPASQCKIVESFRNACISIAFDSVDRWAGWAVADNADKAASEALGKCAEGGKNCKTHSTECDR